MWMDLKFKNVNYRVCFDEMVISSDTGAFKIKLDSFKTFEGSRRVVIPYSRDATSGMLSDGSIVKPLTRLYERWVIETVLLAEIQPKLEEIF